MAAVTGTLQYTNESAEFTPSNAVSEFMIEKATGGTMTLLEKVPSGSWVAIFTGHGAGTIPTPDTAVIYKFRSESVSAACRYRIGP